MLRDDIKMSDECPGAYLIRSSTAAKGDLANILRYELGQEKGYFLTVATDEKGDALFYNPKTGLWRLGQVSEVLHLAATLYDLGMIVQRTKGLRARRDEMGLVLLDDRGAVQMEEYEYHSRAVINDVLIKSAFKIVLWHSRSTEKPKPQPGLAFRNGFLRADPENKKFEFLPHSPKNWAFRRIDKDYCVVENPDQKIPTVNRMRDAVLNGAEDAAEAEETWQTIMYAIAMGAFGLVHQANAFLTVYGPGGNGKTTLFDTLIGMVVQSLEDTASLSPQKFGKDFTMKQLIGARFNYVNDMEDSNVSNMACQVQKALAEGKPISMRTMHKDEYSLELPVMCIYLTNGDAKFMDTSKGFVRRHYHVRMMNDLTKTGLSRAQLVKAAQEEQMAYINFLQTIVLKFWAGNFIEIPRSEKAKRLAEAASANYEREMLEDICEEGTTWLKAHQMRTIFDVYFDQMTRSGLNKPDMRRFCARLSAAAAAKGWYNEHKGYKVQVRAPSTWTGIAEGASLSGNLLKFLARTAPSGIDKKD